VCPGGYVAAFTVKQDNWLFLHYRQILSGSASHRLEEFLKARIKSDFADNSLSHAFSGGNVPPETAAVYDDLRELAQYYPKIQAGVVHQPHNPWIFRHIIDYSGWMWSPTFIH
jgi:hypothetical protein